MLNILLVVWLLVSNLVYADGLKTITAEQFLLQNPSPERKAILDYNLNQFLGWSVSQKELDQIWNNDQTRDALNLARFQIIDQKLYAASIDETSPHFRSYIEYFQRLINKYKIQDVDFMIYLLDDLYERDPQAIYLKQANHLPIFVQSKDLNNPYEANKPILPEPFMLWFSYNELLQKIDQAIPQHPWKDKIEQIYWRGGTTGGLSGAYTIENFSKLPRLSLVILSKLYPDLIDARFSYYMDTSFDSGREDLKYILDILFGTDRSKIKEEDHLKYKYLISIDGNTCAWRRVPWIMYSNSVLIKQETAKIEWFYPALKPYFHYVPVNEKLTDIFEQFEWLKNHDLNAQQISHNARNFVKNELMPEHIDAHMVLILNKYHEIQKDQKLFPTIASAEKTTSFIGVSKAVIAKIIRISENWIKSF